MSNLGIYGLLLSINNNIVLRLSKLAQFYYLKIKQVFDYLNSNYSVYIFK